MAARRGHNEGTIYARKDKDGNLAGYQAQVTIPGSEGKRKTVSGKTKTDVRRKMEELKAAGAQGRLSSGKSYKVGAYLDGWLIRVKETNKSSTYHSYVLNVRRVKPFIGHVRLDLLKPVQIQDCYDALSSSGLAPATVQQVHRTLHRALEDAMRFDLIGRNVSDPTVLPRVTREEMNWYTIEELGRLLQATAGDPFHALWSVLGTTGIRLGEALGLKWTDIDFQRRTLTVNRALQRLRGGEGFAFIEPKSQRGRRTIDLTTNATGALQVHQQQQMFGRRKVGAACEHQDLVFCSAIGTPLEGTNVYRRHWRPATIKANIPLYRIHDLRHTVATQLIMASVNVKTVSDILGHASVSFTLDRYSHVVPSTRRDAATALEMLLAAQRDAV